MVRHNGLSCKAMFEMSCARCPMAVSRLFALHHPTGSDADLGTMACPPCSGAVRMSASTSGKRNLSEKGKLAALLA